VLPARAPALAQQQQQQQQHNCFDANQPVDEDTVRLLKSDHHSPAA
jgi:hypothetical protein